METSVSKLNNNINISQLSDNLLAGLYASGYSNLEEINKDLFETILSRRKVFVKIDYSFDVKIKTFLSSILQSLILNSKKRVLIIVSDEPQLDSYVDIFKKVSSFIDDVNVSSFENMTDTDNIVITESNSLNKNTEIKNLDYIVIDDSINQHLSENLDFKDVNKAILCQNIDEEVMKFVKHLTDDISVAVVEEHSEVAVEEHSEVNSVTVSEAVVEEHSGVAVEESAVVEEHSEVTVEESAVVEEHSEVAVEKKSKEESRKEKINRARKNMNRRLLMKLR